LQKKDDLSDKMEKEGKSEETKELSISLNERVADFVNEFLEKTEGKSLQLVSHFDTDGITSAAITIKALKRLDKNFSTLIVKSLTPDVINSLPKNKPLLFLDLASNSMEYLKELNQEIFIIDHHQINQEIPANVSIVNPQLHENKEEISSAGLCYLFAKKINPQNKDLAPLGVIGMVGDVIENIDVSNNEIAKDSEAIIKRGVKLYPSTRPLNRVLEFSSEPYIPTVTGDKEGVLEFLRELGLDNKGGYKSLIELSEEEMKKMVTAIFLRRLKKNNENLIGNIFLIKHFNQLEDARELSAKINATSRLGEPYTAIRYCLGDSNAKKEVERMYAKYKQRIVHGLRAVERMEKIEKIDGKTYTIINARSKIEDTIIGVIAGILSRSSVYEPGTVVVAMAHSDGDKIKVSARLSGDNGRNVREILEAAVSELGGEFGGHHGAAGCIIERSQENEFIELLKKHLEIELVKL
jgi:single-stranded-DNA-specific exonuclease